MQEPKTCFKCNLVKPVEEFYRHPSMLGGRVNKCKSCNCADVRENRANKADYYREFDQLRSNDPNRIRARAEYAKTDAGKTAGNKAKSAWAARNPIKRSASIVVGNAVRDGVLSKPDCCESCGANARICGHHDDYAKPLDVRWLCSMCHSSWHKENGEGFNGNDLYNNNAVLTTPKRVM